MTPIAPELRALAHATDEISDHLPEGYFQANVCLNYGGRDEICRACRKLAEEVKEGRLEISDIDEAAFGNALDTAGLPEPGTGRS